MKERELREMVRKQLVNMISEAPADSFLGRVGSTVRARLGGRRQQLSKLLGDIDTVRISRLPKAQKIELITALMQQFGITAQDFNAIKQRVSRTLKTTQPLPSAQMGENINEMDPRPAKNLGSLGTKQDRLEKTQAFRQMVKALANKSDSVKTEFVMNLLSSLNLDDVEKKKLKRNINSKF